jgi:hypothetical protein
MVPASEGWYRHEALLVRVADVIPWLLLRFSNRLLFGPFVVGVAVGGGPP